MTNSQKRFCLPYCSIVHTLLRCVLGGLFFWSGISKYQQLDVFYQAAQNYKVLSPVLTHLYSVFIPWLEIGAGLYLLIGLFTRWSAWACNAMIISFLIAITIVLIRGDAVDCGCFFGGEIETVSWGLFARDFGMLLAGLYVSLTPYSKWSVDAFLNGPADTCSPPSKPAA